MSNFINDIMEHGHSVEDKLLAFELMADEYLFEKDNLGYLECKQAIKELEKNNGRA